MARDYENLHDIDDLSDGELRSLVREQLAAHPMLDASEIEIEVADGAVRLSGRVGTETEVRVAERVLTDVLGIGSVENELIVDSLRRAESPEAIDDHLRDEEKREGALLGDRAVPLSPEAEHLEEDLDERLYGTSDVQRAIQDGGAWIPPEGPTPEGGSVR